MGDDTEEKSRLRRSRAVVDSTSVRLRLLLLLVGNTVAVEMCYSRSENRVDTVVDDDDACLLS